TTDADTGMSLLDIPSGVRWPVAAQAERPFVHTCPFLSAGRSFNDYNADTWTKASPGAVHPIWPLARTKASDRGVKTPPFGQNIQSAKSHTIVPADLYQSIRVAHDASDASAAHCSACVHSLAHTKSPALGRARSHPVHVALVSGPW